MMTPERLKAIKDRCERATPGPWRWDDTPWGDGASLLAIGQTDAYGRPMTLLDDGSAAGEYAPTGATEADRAFIAHARTDVPDLVAEVERCWEEIGVLVEVLRRLANTKGQLLSLREVSEELGLYEDEGDDEGE